LSTRIVLIEDHHALRKGLGLLLGHRGCDVAGTAGDVAGAREIIAQLAPQVAVVDVSLGPESGIELTREILVNHPACRVVLYTGHEDERLLHDGLAAGALGYALKNGEIDELLEAIRAAAAGARYVDPRLRHLIDAAPSRAPLSKREREIMDLLAEGLTGEQVAEHLFLSAATVKTHIRNAMGKLEATTRVHAVALGLRDGQISPPAVSGRR
jgi:DNA-binding NarL/FixJ family response regulator